MDYLAEHQPVPDAGLSDNYIPTDEERKNIKTVEKIFERYKKAKSKYDEKWNDHYNMFRGRQWKEKRPSFRHSEVINLIFREIQSTVPMLTDTKPRFEFLPQEPSDLELSNILNQVAESDWTKYNWTFQLAENLFDSHIFGTGIGSMLFNQDLEGGLGAAEFKSEDPFYVFPGSMATNVNEGCRAFVKAEPMDIAEIKEKWPNGKYVKSDIVSIKKMDKFDGQQNRYLSPTANYTTVDGSQQYDMNEEPQALVVTCYMSGAYEIEEIKDDRALDDGSVESTYTQKHKYPNGRKLVICNNIQLEEAIGEYDDGKFPYARLQNYINQRQFWGISDIEQLESPQRMFNKLVSFTLDVLTLMGNPIWLVGTGSGVDTENLFNQPGMIVEAENIDLVKRQEGVQLQPYVLQVIDRVKLWFDDLSGSSDVSRGAKPEGVTAASAIQALQEATLTRVRQKSKNLDAYLQDLGQLYLSRVFQFYTAPRIFRLTNQDGTNKYFKFHVEHTKDQNGNDIKVARYRQYDTSQGVLKEGEETVKPISGLMDVKVATGSNLPFAKADKEQRLFNLYDRKIIDATEVLKGLDYPNAEAILQRMAANQAMAQQQQPQQ